MANIDLYFYSLVGGVITGIIPALMIYPFTLVKNVVSYSADLKE